MAMLQMQRISIYALKKDRKRILELLQRRGILEINDIIQEDNVFHKMDVTKARSGFEKHVVIANEALEILNHHAPLKKSMFSALNGRKVTSIEDYSAFSGKYEDSVQVAVDLISYSKEIAELKAEIIRLEAQIVMLTPWMKLDIPINFSITEHTKSFIGAISKEWSLEAILDKLKDFLPVEVEIISSSKEQTCIFALCPTTTADGVYNILRSMDFTTPGVSMDKAPVEQKVDLENRILEAKTAINKTVEAIVSLAKYREDIMFLQDYDRMRSDKYEVIGQLTQTNNIVVISGYIPEREIQEIEKSLNKDFLVAIEVEKPSEEEDVPVLLKNNGFAQPLEWVVAGFSLPGKGEIDPTMIMALFYYMLFGIMLADAGYGTLMVGVCAFCLIKYKHTIELSLKNFLTMFLFCGIATIFWGVMFGSYFGDLFDVTASTFFGATQLPIIPPLWFFPVDKPMLMLAFSMVLGLIHLMTGLVIKMYQLYKQKEYKALLYDAISWFALIVSSAILVVSLDMIKSMMGPGVSIPPALTKVATIIAILASIMILLTNGRESRNPFKRFLKGAYALYGITGYLSDVLSYSRLLALGLASGIIGNVINKMAAMPAKSPLGPFFFIIIVIGGHALNIAINALGSYVHTTRLSYVEFFGKFYGGGGRFFHPFQMKTKYYKIKENMKNEN